MAKELKITQIKSVIGYDRKQRSTIETLGIKKLNQSVVCKDTPQTRGMIQKVKHLLLVEEILK
jgi:large subunit ribosomal protein L30